jgi:hypothetical protein
MDSGFLPQNLAFIAKKMEGYSRNRFRLETTSADTASAGRIITVNLPENSLLDMKSFCWWFDATTGDSTTTGNGKTFTNSANIATCNAVGKLPNDTSSLIRNVEVYINGVQVQQGSSHYNTVAHILKLGRGNSANDSTKEAIVNFAKMGGVDSTNIAVADSNTVTDNLSTCVDKWYGFLNESSTRFLPTDLLGAIQVRITLADNAVLSPSQLATASIGLNMVSNSNYVPPVGLFYTVKNMYFTIDTISLDPMYSMAIRDMLQREQFIPLNFKEYYCFTLDGQTGTSYTNRFSLSSSSIDKLYAIQRPASFQSEGQIAVDLGSSAVGDRFIPNFFKFKLFESAVASLNGTFRYNFSINNVKHPQYQARASEAIRDLAFVNGKLGDESVGFIPTSIASYKEAQAVVPLTLCHPEQPVSVMSGYNSKGINTQLTYEVTGLSNVGTYQSLVCAEVTSQLRIASGKNLAVSH